MYVVYQITNLINGKIYVGAHKTDNPNDRYMGSGKLILAAIRKHGRENFKKDILGTFDDRDSAFDLEAKIVNEEFILRSDTYNMCVGGCGGWKGTVIPGVKRSWSSQMSPEAKERVRQVHLNKVVSDETKAKMRRSRLAYFARKKAALA